MSDEPKTLKEFYDGDYLQPDDIGHKDDYTGNEWELEISGIVPPEFETDAKGDLIEDAMLCFKGAKKKLILNKTMYRTLKWTIGFDDSKWVGQKIKIGLRWGDWFGEKNSPAIRVIPPEGCHLPVGVRRNIGRERPK